MQDTVLIWMCRRNLIKLWKIFGQVQNKKIDCKFILCPVCSNKTHTITRKDTKVKELSLYYPKRKHETIINAQDMKITLKNNK